MPSRHTSKGELVIQLIAQMEDAGITVVYLRNHEELPQSIGNDVDLLVPLNMRTSAINIISQSLKDTGWAISRVVEFGPLSVFLCTIDGSDFFHIDLFDRIEWHWLEYADTKAIIQGRQHNGMVYHPNIKDETVVNLMSYLVYAGTIRNKHRDKTSRLIEHHGFDSLLESCTIHLGSNISSQVSQPLKDNDWQALESLTKRIKLKLCLHQVLRHPVSALRGLGRYTKRACCRLIRPPGPFLVFEGADGVGKSTIIEAILPLLQLATGRSNTLLFHWKPSSRSIRTPGQNSGPSHSPHMKRPRSKICSLVFLVYHWLGFWIGYCRFILPARAANRAVVGDRYAHEFFLDPQRLRLNLPRSILNMAAATVPNPDLVIGLVAKPKLIVSRKAELSVDEIASYQEKMSQFASSNMNFTIINADSNEEQVIAAAKAAVFNCFFRPSLD